METPQSLFEAARRGDIRHIRRVLEMGANVNARDEHGNTALMEASAWGRIEIVQCLAGTPGADVNSTNREGFTAFLKAAAGGHMDVVQYLAKRCGANVDATTVFGDSAAMLAAQYGHTDLAQYLVAESGFVVGTTSHMMLRKAGGGRDRAAWSSAYSDAGGERNVVAEGYPPSVVARVAEDGRSATSGNA